MKKRVLFLILIISLSFIIGEISAFNFEDRSYGLGKDPELAVPINYSLIPTVNSSDYWDNLDLPQDIQYSALNADADFWDGNVDLGSNNITTSGTYNTLSIIPSSDWIYLSGDGSIEEGLDIGIPIYAGRDFYYGYGGAEDHHFGIASALTIASDGDLTTTGDITTTSQINTDILDATTSVHTPFGYFGLYEIGDEFIKSTDGTVNLDSDDLTTSGRIITTGGDPVKTGKFLTGNAGNTVFSFSGGNFDIRAGDGTASAQNVMRVDNSGDFDFYAGNLVTTGDLEVPNINVTSTAYLNQTCFVGDCSRGIFSNSTHTIIKW